MKKLLVLPALIIPTVAMASGSYAEGVCKKLMPAIYRDNNVAGLEWMRLGDPKESQPLLTCMYRAVIPDSWGDIPVRVTVVLNKSSNSFTTKIE